MKVIKPLALGLLTRPTEFRRRFFLGVAAISFCPMGERPALLGEVAMWKFLAGALPPEQPLDLALPKTAAEFLVTGSAFAPGGQAVPALPVTVRLGSVSKQLVAVGDRHLDSGLPTRPVPFTEMPLGWDRAYGGPKYTRNPLGRGIEEMPIAGIGYRVALPNVVLPQGAEQPRTPEPVGFGPLDIAWPQRSQHAGTHDQRWLEEDFPGFARDTDWRILMAASPDQRFPGFLRGDEDYALTNLHRTKPELAGRLPGLAPRILIQRRGREALEEVPLNLTTVWFFPAAERLVMVHHGRARVEEEDARDVLRLVLGADRLGAPRPVADFARVLADRLHPEYGALEALRDSALVPPETIVPDPDLEAQKALVAEQGLLRKRGRARQLREHERARQEVAALGLDPDEHVSPPPPEEELPSLEDLPAAIERMKAEAERAQREGEDFLAAQRAEVAGPAEAAGIALPAPEEPPCGPPRFSAAATQAELEAEAAAAEAEGKDAALLRATLADPAILKLWTDAEEQQRQGYLAGADGQRPVPRLDRAANAALRARLLDGQRGGKRLDLCGADLAGLDLSGFDLAEAWLDGADLTGADLSRARLTRAVLAHARLVGARLCGAELSEANLGRAELTEAD
ncbi:MAG TPA: DUF2169 domain-containing protein, partial [Crenalkalicoccus sp.]|nr:DUF2169 domain-containing protein [Crenalkalicoccus sp.]